MDHFLCIHAARHLRNPSIILNEHSIVEIENILNSAGSIKYIEKTIDDYRSKVAHALKQLPFGEKYKRLLLSYVTANLK